MNPLKKLLGQTAIYGLSSIVGRLLNYLLVPLYTYVFADPSDYGVVSELYAYVAFLVVFLTFGMETTFFRYIKEKTDKETVFRNTFLTVLVINVLFFLIGVFFLQEIADWLLYPKHSEYVFLLLIIVCVDACSSIPLARLRSEEKAKQFAGIQVASILVNIGLNLLFMLTMFNKDHPEQGVLYILIANLISAVVKPALLYKYFLQLRFKFDIALGKEMLVYALPLVVAGFAGIVNETLDRAMLKKVLFENGHTIEDATAQVGIYSAVYKLAMLVSILLQAYRYAAEPFFFSQAKNQDKNKLYSKLMNYFVATVCLVFLVVSLDIDIFKHFIRNESYWVGLGVVPILLLANVFLGIYYNQSIWYKLSGQTKFGAYISIGGAILTITINWIFIPTYGYWACAWATLIVYASQMIASYILGQKYYPIKYNLRKFFFYMILAMVLFFICKGLDIQSLSMRLIVHNLCIGLFVWFAWKLEKPTKAVG
ncbi:MAG: oligosaccharide flippase family protein [Crocinitomicaceae bacterium]